ncbi:MAG: hypothetical protein A2087_05210 [Spirochaetes bacterium GWD1_61_31]|nr:MAG: hypothetical protein A2Y37_00955 [Spirochaetes bacterium GWB1_60_80]OHD35392.1 MAG: hypothetical protein A2004_09195 [Spirochaetes bacterium GWC1_61_12]OHD36542.1 MAG: hypothetical protein A2087_05210 [Spirochaetes bacterium GWD1_61_31]OHD42256.1 MAG: hypothetical protein A2Y35_09405 [Spirochaetes bacterium GWE1_60_18]OHD58185.1 MAG: hypothetical protein A2Y32_14975 [Spirochaetes bacterium GWF1_60_12]HBO40885.1 hypothetical protein [Spirochaetaceae bacterium]
MKYLARGLTVLVLVALLVACGAAKESVDQAIDATGSIGDAVADAAAALPPPMSSEELAALSWQDWLKEYERFIDQEFLPARLKAAENDVSAIMQMMTMVPRLTEFSNRATQFIAEMPAGDLAQFNSAIERLNAKIKTNP